MARIPVPTYAQHVAVNGPLLDANARGGQLTDATGQAMERAGSALDESAHWLQRRENDQATAWAMNTASQFKLDQYKKFQQARDTAPNGGQGTTSDGSDALTPSYLKSYDTDADKLLQAAPTARARKYLTMHLDQFRTTMGETALREEYTLGKSHQIGQLTEAVDASAHLIGDPGGDLSQYSTELTNHLNAIKAMNLPEDVRQQQSDRVKKVLTDSYWTAFVRDNPQGAANALKGQLPTPASADGSPGIPDKIKAQAAAQGVDPHVALAIAHLESGIDPNAKNKASSATGVFQVIDETWGGLGGTKDNRGDPDAQIQLGVKNLAQNAKALKQTLGREPSPGEQYMAQLFGIGGASAILKSPDSKPVHDVVAAYDPKNADATVNANGMRGLTVGQVKTLWDGAIAKHLHATQGLADAPAPGQPPAPPVDPGVKAVMANTPIPQQLAYLTHAEAMARKDDSQERAALTGRVNDSTAAYARGESAPNAPTLPELVKTLGPVKGAQEFAKLGDMQQFAYTVSGLKTMPEAQIQSTLAQAKPAPGPDYAEKAATYDALQRAAQYTREQRVADPIANDQNNGSKLTQPLDTSTPDFLTSAMSARFSNAEQVAHDYSTPYKVFSAQEAQQFGAMIDKLPVAQATQYLGALHAAAGPRMDQYMAALAQIAPNHPSIAVAGALQAKQAPGATDIASAILLGDRMLNPQKSDKAEGQRKVDILMPQDGGFGGFRQAWQASTGGAYGPNYVSEEQDFAAAKAAYIGLQKPGDRKAELDQNLWNTVMRSMAPTTTHAGTTTLVPLGTDPAAFSDHVASLWPQVTHAAGIDPAVYPASTVKLQAFDDGKYMAYVGDNPVHRSDGVPLAFDMQGNVLTGPPIPTGFTPALARTSIPKPTRRAEFR